MIKASFTFSDDFLIEANRRYRQQKRILGIKTSFLISLLFLLILAFPSIMFFRLGKPQLCIVLLPFLFLASFQRLIEEKIIRWRFVSSPYRNDRLTIEFSEDGFHGWSEIQNSTLHWGVFSKVVQFKDGFLLFQGPNLCNWIPITSLANPNQVSELLDLLKRKIPKFEIFDEV
ncbi:MAG: YcxB family protein [Acidobacteria bacterium]|nr:YcxB family protein [Acidobacteriota bacterium]